MKIDKKTIQLAIELGRAILAFLAGVLGGSSISDSLF